MAARLVVSAALLLCLFACAKATGTCDAGWTDMGSGCAKLLLDINSKSRRNNAEKLCQADDAASYLPRPQSTAECDTISTIAGYKRVWIDLNWDDSDGRWEFSDNTQPSYTRWANKTPYSNDELDNGMGRDGDYVYLQSSGRSKSRNRGAVGNGDAKWVDVSLKKKCAVVCQKDYS